MRVNQSIYVYFSVLIFTRILIRIIIILSRSFSFFLNLTTWITSALRGESTAPHDPQAPDSLPQDGTINSTELSVKRSRHWRLKAISLLTNTKLVFSYRRARCRFKASSESLEYRNGVQNSRGKLNNGAPIVSNSFRVWFRTSDERKLMKI